VGTPVSLKVTESEEFRTVLVSSLGLFIWEAENLVCHFLFGSIVFTDFFSGLDLCIGGGHFYPKESSVVCVFNSGGVMIGSLSEVLYTDTHCSNSEESVKKCGVSFQPEKFFSLRNEQSPRKLISGEDALSLAMFDGPLDSLLLVNSDMDVRVCLGMNSSLSSTPTNKLHSSISPRVQQKLFVSNLTCSVSPFS